MLLLKEMPQYECLLERARRYPELDPSAMEACLHLLRTSTDVFDFFHSTLARHGLSQGRFTVLSLLNREPGRPVNLADLAERSGVTRATMTGLIDTLERDGLVKREHFPEDRRMVLVRLTDKGASFIDEILPVYFRQVSAVMSGLSVGDRKTLVLLMTKVGARVAASKG